LSDRFLGLSFGKYRVERVIGSGAFAWVYLASEPEPHASATPLVAIKVLKPHFAGDTAIEDRFQREAATAARLNHLNIVRILDVGRDQGVAYFTMDYLPNTLAARLQVMTTFPEPLLLRLGSDVASALAYAHAAGVIHRDIKPENILFSASGDAVLADFGIARALVVEGERTSTNVVLGTPQYFSPEQARGLSVDGRTDIYALGVTLFRAATGELPFAGSDWYEVARRHVEEPPPSPRSLNPTLSEGTERIILRCLAKRPEDRFADAEALAMAIARVSRGEDAGVELVESSPTMFVAGQSRSSVVRRRRRRIAAAAITAVLLSAGGVVYARWIPHGLTSATGTTSMPTSPLPDSSAAADSGAAGASAPVATRPAVARLAIIATDSGRITIDGRSVGIGRWRTDSMTPGRYEVRASVRTISDCVTAQQRETISLGAGDARDVRLATQRCGTLPLNPRPADAQVTITDAAGKVRFSGVMPATHRFVLPAGSYRVEMRRDGCRPYSASFDVPPNAQGTGDSPRLECKAD
jgi:serine/threonine protein kinase